MRMPASSMDGQSFTIAGGRPSRDMTTGTVGVSSRWTTEAATAMAASTKTADTSLSMRLSGISSHETRGVLEQVPAPDALEGERVCATATAPPLLRAALDSRAALNSLLEQVAVARRTYSSWSSPPHCASFGVEGGQLKPWMSVHSPLTGQLLPKASQSA